MSGQQKNTEVAMLKFKVFGQDYIQFYFRVRVNVPMIIVKKCIAHKLEVKVGSITLIFDGRVISDEATPKQLELEEDDLIELYFVNK